MKKKLLLSLVVFAGVLFGQESVVLSFKFQPNKHYLLRTEIISESIVDFKADSLILKEIKKSGISIPIHSESTISMDQEIITSKPNSDGCLDVEMLIKGYKTKVAMNGQDMGNLIPDEMKDIKVNAVYHPENKLEVKEVVGENVSIIMEKSIREMMAKTINKFNFPDTVMMVGDSFHQEVPLEIPIANMGVMKIKVISDYRLERIEEEKSYFNVVSSIKLDTNAEKFKSEAAGTGEGEFIYDSNLKYIRSYNMDMRMNLKMNLGKVTIVTESDTETKVSCVEK